VVAQRLPAKTSPMSILPIFPLGGAFTDVGDDDTAFGGRRSARFAFNMDAVALDPEGMAADREWVRSLWDALRPFATNSGSYVNVMTDYDEDRVRAAYGPAKYQRLARIKGGVRPGERPAPQREHQARLTVRTTIEEIAGGARKTSSRGAWAAGRGIVSRYGGRRRVAGGGR